MALVCRVFLAIPGEAEAILLAREVSESPLQRAGLVRQGRGSEVVEGEGVPSRLPSRAGRALPGR